MLALCASWARQRREVIVLRVTCAILPREDMPVPLEYCDTVPESTGVGHVVTLYRTSILVQLAQCKLTCVLYRDD
jgi:hypothetical protein